jgi:acetyl esterase/lipase
VYERLEAIDRLNTTMKLLLPRILCALGLVASGALAQEVIPLYPGTPPGSVETSYPERHYFSKAWNAEVVSNVTKPSLTLYRPIAGGNGNAVVVCPGGGFMALSIDNEGTEVAKWLAARGMTAFVLKYRLAHTGEDATQEFLALFEEKAKLEEMLKKTVALSIADGIAAVAYLRKHASDWGISPDKVGIIGFSAGGTVTAAAGLRYTPESRPAFVAPIYPAASMLKDDAVPADAPPMFLAAATDDQFKLVPDSISLYNRWIAASKSAELHIYAKGGHGFGMRKQGYPTDQWIDRFAEWLDLQGFMKR